MVCAGDDFVVRPSVSAHYQYSLPYVAQKGEVWTLPGPDSLSVNHLEAVLSQPVRSLQRYTNGEGGRKKGAERRVSRRSFNEGGSGKYGFYFAEASKNSILHSSLTSDAEWTLPGPDSLNVNRLEAVLFLPVRSPLAIRSSEYNERGHSAERRNGFYFAKASKNSILHSSLTSDAEWTLPGSNR